MFINNSVIITNKSKVTQNLIKINISHTINKKSNQNLLLLLVLFK